MNTWWGVFSCLLVCQSFFSLCFMKLFSKQPNWPVCSIVSSPFPEFEWLPARNEAVPWRMSVDCFVSIWAFISGSRKNAWGIEDWEKRSVDRMPFFKNLIQGSSGEQKGGREPVPWKNQLGGGINVTKQRKNGSKTTLEAHGKVDF